jgi:hypothetical protein
MPQFIYKIGLFILILFLSFYSIELSFIASVFLLVISASNKTVVSLTLSAILLTIVVLTGIISSYELKYSFFDILKDILYFVRPITILLASYFAVKRIKSHTYVFNTVIVIALFFAIKHLAIVLINIGHIDSYVYLRNLGGKQNHIEMVAIVFLFFTPYHTIFKKYEKFVKYILITSFILYLSRTMFIILFIFFLGYKGYLFFSQRYIKRLFIFSILWIIIGVAISSIETDRESKGLKAFVYKTQNSFNELFESIDTKEIVNDRRTLWEHWRAYEAKKALDQISENGSKAWLIGLGLGAQIDLGTYVHLDGKYFTEVPSIHNGFVYVLFKTGIIGFIFYVWFIGHIFITHQKFRTKDSNILFNKLIIATSLYMLFNSFVITGIFRPGEFSVFLYGILIASKYKSERLNPIFKSLN